MSVSTIDLPTDSTTRLIEPEKPISIAGLWRRLAWILLVLLAYIALAMAFEARSVTRGLDSLPLVWAWLDMNSIQNWGRWSRVLVPIVLLLVWLKLGAVLPCRSVFTRLAIFYAFVVAFNVSTCLIDGDTECIIRPFNSERLEFFYDVPRVESPRQFFHDYPALINHLALHTRTHPPGAVVFLWLGVKIFGGGVWTASLWAIGITALGAIPFYLLALRVAGARGAHVAATIYLVTPNLVLFGATSMDGVYVPLLCLAGLLYRHALDVRRHSSAAGLGAIIGLTLATSMLLTYATVCIGLFMTVFGVLSFTLGRNRARLTAILVSTAAVFFACQVAQLWVLRYDVVASLRASYEFDRALMNSHSLSTPEYLDISITNLLAFAIGGGVLSAALFAEQFWRDLRATLRRRAPQDLGPLAFGLTLVTLAFIRMFTFETERVWTFLSPWMVLYVATMICRRTKGELNWRGFEFPRTVIAFVLFVAAQTLLTERFINTGW